MAPAGGQSPSAPASTRATIAYTSCDVDGPYIALTFDDGPNPETTPKLLKMLEQHGAKATFFVVGQRAVENPELLKRMVAAGHEVANHSWNHPELPKLPVAAVDKQVADTNAAIKAATGKAPTYLRPPYGAMTPALRAHIEQTFGMTLVYWSVDPLDWKDRDSQKVADRIIANTRPGSIVLAHDIHATTVAAMPKVLDALAAKGFKFVTVSELIAMHKPSAPKVASLAPAAVRKKPRSAAQAAKPAAVKPMAASGVMVPPGAVPASARPAKPGSASKPSMSQNAGSVSLY